MNEAILDRVQAPFSAWQRDIIFEKKKYSTGKDEGAVQQAQVLTRQKKLEAAVSSGPKALGRYLRTKLELGADETIGAPIFPRPKLTPGEYLNPPVLLEAELSGAWADDISPKWGSRAVFWLLCHIEWIEQERLGGASDLNEALMAGPSSGGIEGRTRNFLRRTGGLPVVRGKTSVFSDCTLARAWWRHRLAEEIADATDNEVPAATAHRVLHANRPAWERLVMLSLRRLTVINHPRARAAIVRELAERLRMYGAIDQQQVLAIAVSLARLGLRNSLDHVGTETLAWAAASARRPSA
ncbi:hypothetical protein [Candidatus Palauibacter sp.]|uniref:hypothetical protein n=1 Tax=Candidatus Palauibacter sp. TaxID=3101350 RepID=UPI003B0110AA